MREVIFIYLDFIISFILLCKIILKEYLFLAVCKHMFVCYGYVCVYMYMDITVDIWIGVGIYMSI